MKALTIPQPRATLLAHGALSLLTFGQSTTYRGRLAIHAGVGLSEYQKTQVGRWPYADPLAKLDIRRWQDLDLGCVVGTIELLDCFKIREGTRSYTHLRGKLGCDVLIPPGAGNNLYMSNWRLGRWAWIFGDPQSLAAGSAEETGGHPNIWELPKRIGQQIEQALYEAYTEVNPVP